MPREQKRNLHVPLPEGLYRQLRAEAERTQRPATDLAREAIDRWLLEERRATLHDEIARYAAAAAGTESDLAPDLEAAAIEHLRAGAARKRPSPRKRR